MTTILLKRKYSSKIMEAEVGKRLVSCLIFVGIIVATVSFINAAIAGVTFITPTDGDNLSGSYLVSWVNSGNVPGLYLQHAANGCNETFTNLSGPFDPPSLTSYSWDTTGTPEGIHCLRLFDNVNNITSSGNFTIDNTAPVASLSAGQPYLCNEGSNVTLDASASFDLGTGISLYEWDLDNDGQYDDGNGVMINYTCMDGDSNESVSVRVRDYANNSDTDTENAIVSNVAPVCNGITAPGDSAVTEPVTFTQNATDVADSLTYSWVLGDGNTNNSGSVAVHVYNTAGTYNVTVNVSDGDGGSCMSSTMITVVNPTILQDQEVMTQDNFPLQDRGKI